MVPNYVAIPVVSIHYGCHPKTAITEEANTMADNPNETRKLDDSQLDEVTGGSTVGCADKKAAYLRD